MPVGTPFLRGRYRPPKARTRISKPRSLSKSTCVVPALVSMHTRNPIKTVLPEPVGPITLVWPMSLRLPPSSARGSLACSEK